MPISDQAEYPRGILDVDLSVDRELVPATEVRKISHILFSNGGAQASFTLRDAADTFSIMTIQVPANSSIVIPRGWQTVTGEGLLALQLDVNRRVTVFFLDN